MSDFGFVFAPFDYKSATVDLIAVRIASLRHALTEVRGYTGGRVEFMLDRTPDKRAALERELAEAELIHLPAAARREREQ